MIYLNCPFPEKDRAKALGARWDINTKKWYVPEGTSLEPFQKWLPKSVILSQEIVSLPTPADGKPQYTVSKFILNLQTVFYDLYATEIWLLGQITKLKTKDKGLEIQLIDFENNTDLQNASAITVTAWGESSKLIVTKMEQSGLQLQEGLLVNLKVKPQFHKRYHVGGQVTDIDPAATLGELALLQRQIREKLKQEGIYNKNKLLPKPFDYSRVAVIHPSNASGYHDFKKDADILQKLNLCEFIYYPSTFEGINVENELLNALDLAFEENIKNPLDAIVIIRGGGARQGLLNLIKESIVRKICLSPIPVIVGLGHADDKLLLDEVANTSVDTPSKAIAHIKNTIQQNAREAIDAFYEIKQFGINILRAKGKDVNDMFTKIAWQSKTRINQASSQISAYKQEINVNSKIRLNNWQNKISLLSQQLSNTKNIIAKYTQDVSHISEQINTTSRSILIQAKHRLANY